MAARYRIRSLDAKFKYPIPLHSVAMSDVPGLAQSKGWALVTTGFMLCLCTYGNDCHTLRGLCNVIVEFS